MEQKSKEKLVCYCFGYTAGNIEDDALTHGRSLIMAKIMAEKKAGGCSCKQKNPSGR